MYEEEGARAPEAAPRTAVLDRERERRLFLRYRRFGDLGARRQLIERSLPLARRLARRYRHDNVALDDLVQVASVGLVKAVDGFDPGRGLAFSTYAVPTITGELKRYFRDSGWGVHLPRATQERVLKLRAVTERLSDELGRAPAPAEVAERSELSAEEISEAMEASVAARLASLDASDDGRSAGSSRDGRRDSRSLDVEEGGFSLVEERDAVARAMSEVSEEERLVLRLRFWDDLTQSQIAERLGVSQMQVSRVLRRTLQRLRDAADAPPVSGAAASAAGSTATSDPVTAAGSVATADSVAVAVSTP